MTDTAGEPSERVEVRVGEPFGATCHECGEWRKVVLDCTRCDAAAGAVPASRITEADLGILPLYLKERAEKLVSVASDLAKLSDAARGWAAAAAGAAQDAREPSERDRAILLTVDGVGKVAKTAVLDRLLRAAAGANLAELTRLGQEMGDYDPAPASPAYPKFGDRADVQQMRGGRYAYGDGKRDIDAPASPAVREAAAAALAGWRRFQRAGKPSQQARSGVHEAMDALEAALAAEGERRDS